MAGCFIRLQKKNIDLSEWYKQEKQLQIRKKKLCSLDREHNNFSSAVKTQQHKDVTVLQLFVHSYNYNTFDSAVVHVFLPNTESWFPRSSFSGNSPHIRLKDPLLPSAQFPQSALRSSPIKPLNGCAETNAVRGLTEIKQLLCLCSNFYHILNHL